MAVGHTNGFEARPLLLFALRPGLYRGSSFREREPRRRRRRLHRSLHDSLHDLLHDSLDDDGALDHLLDDARRHRHGRRGLPSYVIGAMLGAKHVRVRRQRGVVLRLLVQQQERADACYQEYARRRYSYRLVQIHHPCRLFLTLSTSRAMLLIFVLSRHLAAKAQRVRD